MTIVYSTQYFCLNKSNFFFARYYTIIEKLFKWNKTKTLRRKRNLDNLFICPFLSLSLSHISALFQERNTLFSGQNKTFQPKSRKQQTFLLLSMHIDTYSKECSFCCCALSSKYSSRFKTAKESLFPSMFDDQP